MSTNLTARVCEFFETLTPASVTRLGEIYSADVYFKDPFNEVAGLANVEKIFTHMYEVLDNPRFVMTGQVLEGAQCFLTWDFMFMFKNFSKSKVQTIRGATHLKFVTQADKSDLGADARMGAEFFRKHDTPVLVDGEDLDVTIERDRQFVPLIRIIRQAREKPIDFRGQSLAARVQCRSIERGVAVDAEP